MAGNRCLRASGGEVEMVLGEIIFIFSLGKNGKLRELSRSPNGCVGPGEYQAVLRAAGAILGRVKTKGPVS